MTKYPLLGCIADDFTGATDLCNTLVKQGMRTVQLINVPDNDFVVPEADAIVIALKSRSCPVDEAINLSLAALGWLHNAGVKQYFFKYCSTFDSTDAGNIGPVADALLDTLGSDFSIACPAFPETGRTLFKGHLFVGDELLSDSPMRNHPLNPMTDSNLVRVLGRQTPHKVGLVQYDAVNAGAAAIATEFEQLRQQGIRHAIVDAISDEHLFAIGHACKDMLLLTGGSGIALGLPDNFRQQGLLAATDSAASLPKIDGLEAVISGSCSSATLAQVAAMQQQRPSFAVKPLALAEHADEIITEALAWAEQNMSQGPVLIYASAPPEEVQQIQQVLGREQAGALIEKTLSRIASGLVDQGVKRLVIAGGETSGAVVQALGVKGLQIGSQIDPGVPWTVSLGARAELALALKSGNFGSKDFFLKALQVLP